MKVIGSFLVENKFTTKDTEFSEQKDTLKSNHDVETKSINLFSVLSVYSVVKSDLIKRTRHIRETLCATIMRKTFLEIHGLFQNP